MPRLKFSGMGPRPRGSCLNPALTVDIFLNDCVNYCDNIIIIRKIMNWKDLNGRYLKFGLWQRKNQTTQLKEVHIILTGGIRAGFSSKTLTAGGCSILRQCEKYLRVNGSQS